MTPLLTMYAFHAAISVGLTVWVGRTLSRHGRVFLLDVFAGNDALADAVNRLLLVGFYLLNLGYVSLTLRTRDAIATSEAAVEMLSWKVGLVLVVLGAFHFLNMWVLSRARRKAIDRRAADERADAQRRAALAALSAPPPAPLAAEPRLATLGAFRGPDAPTA